MTHLRDRLTYANVVATLALFLALGGGAVWAAGEVTSQDLAKRAVKTKNIADNAVKSPQIKNNDVNSGDIRDQNITGTDIAENTIETSDLRDGAVKGGKVANSTLTGGHVQDGTLTGDDVQDSSLRGIDVVDGSLGLSDLAIKPGETMRGAVGADFNAVAGLEDFGVVASLPIPAANVLTDDDVFIHIGTWSDGGGQTVPATTDTSASCSGSLDNPVAAPGKVCVYVAGGDNATDVNGYSVVPGTGGSRFGFKLGWTSAADGDTFIDAIWAYTAP